MLERKRILNKYLSVVDTQVLPSRAQMQAKLEQTKSLEQLRDEMFDLTKLPAEVVEVHTGLKKKQNLSLISPAERRERQAKRLLAQ